MKRFFYIGMVALMAIATVGLTACSKDNDNDPADTTSQGGGNNGGGNNGGGYVAGNNYFTGHSWLGHWQDYYNLHRDDGGMTYVDFNITLDFISETTGVLGQNIVIGQSYDQGTEDHPFTYTCEAGTMQESGFVCTVITMTLTDPQDVDEEGNPLQLIAQYDPSDSTLAAHYGVVLNDENGQQEFNASCEYGDFLVFYKQH